jgi:hypothetical protein
LKYFLIRRDRIRGHCGYLSQLEKGAFCASLKIIGKLAVVLEVEPAELLKLPPKRSARRK